MLYAGINPSKLGCTMLQANALGGTLLSLAMLAKMPLGWDMAKELQTSDWNAETLTSDQIAYAALDAIAVLKIHRLQSEALARKSLRVRY